MTMSRKIALVVALAVLPTGAAACEAAIANLRQAIKQGDLAQVEKAVKDIQVRADCSGNRIIGAQRIAANALMAEINKRLAAGEGNKVEPLLITAHSLRGSWVVADLLGQLRVEQKRYAEATHLFQEALDLINDKDRTPQAPPKEQIAEVFKRGQDARMLAATYVAGTTRSNKPGGLASADIRGFVPEAVAVPITFNFNSTEFTPEGRKAVDDLADTLAKEPPGQLTLVGHTDEQGDENYNLKLSIQRANAVKAYLESRGLSIPIEVRGEGEGRKYDIANRESYSQDEQYQLDRRVEFIRR